MSPSEVGLAYIIGSFVLGASFGACVGAVVAGLCRAAAVGDALIGHRPPPRFPPSGQQIDELRRDIDRWHAQAIATLDGMDAAGRAR
jgi:hypothetical protein